MFREEGPDATHQLFSKIAGCSTTASVLVFTILIPRRKLTPRRLSPTGRAMCPRSSNTPPTNASWYGHLRVARELGRAPAEFATWYRPLQKHLKEDNNAKQMFLAGFKGAFPNILQMSDVGLCRPAVLDAVFHSASAIPHRPIIRRVISVWSRAAPSRTCTSVG